MCVCVKFFWSLCLPAPPSDQSSGIFWAFEKGAFCAWKRLKSKRKNKFKFRPLDRPITVDYIGYHVKSMIFAARMDWTCRKAAAQEHEGMIAILEAACVGQVWAWLEIATEFYTQEHRIHTGTQHSRCWEWPAGDGSSSTIRKQNFLKAKGCS